MVHPNYIRNESSTHSRRPSHLLVVQFQKYNNSECRRSDTLDVCQYSTGRILPRQLRLRLLGDIESKFWWILVDHPSSAGWWCFEFGEGRDIVVWYPVDIFGEIGKSYGRASMGGCREKHSIFDVHDKPGTGLWTFPGMFHCPIYPFVRCLMFVFSGTDEIHPETDLRKDGLRWDPRWISRWTDASLQNHPFRLPFRVRSVHESSSNFVPWLDAR